MNTIKITIPDGFKVKKFDEQTGEVSFEPIPKDIKERIKNFDDVLSELGITANDFRRKTHALPDDTIAYEQIKLIAKALNEGWTPDWSNDNQYKYYPWFVMGSPSGSGFSFNDAVFWVAGSYVGSRLCFKSRELAEYAGKTFTDIYKDFLTLKND